MKNVVRLQLQTNATQHARLVALQHAFARACNELAPIVQQTACWNRVALHHMVYKTLRAKFPDLGSQMICNAIYSVSRSCRLVYQHPGSPFNVQRLAGRPLPRVHFLPESPVYFDRHTLSLKDGQASMFTLDGRMRFHMALSAADEQRFRTEKLSEIVLNQKAGQFWLTFQLDDGQSPLLAPDADGSDAAGPRNSELPEYMLVIEDAPPSGATLASLPAATQQMTPP